LKISKGRSEAENRKRKDNTMAERKMTKGYTMLHYTENKRLSNMNTAKTQGLN
jgi:hypothetical protein